jgi:cation diffusion facilitator family transporter
MLAALFIIVAAIQKWIAGLELQNLGTGTLVTLAAAGINAALGLYLVRTGHRTGSLILEANGKHVLTDSWTSFGVVTGLLLVVWTGWKPFDPLCAIVVALNILWSGWELVMRSIGGLMDAADPALGRLLREKLDLVCAELGVQYHGVRFRSTGNRLRIELHLLFSRDVSVGQAHRLATALEERLPAALGMPAEVVTHLESAEDHQEIHRGEHYMGKPE